MTHEEDLVTESERQRCRVEAVRDGGGAGCRRGGMQAGREAGGAGNTRRVWLGTQSPAVAAGASGGGKTYHSRKFITRNLMKFFFVTDK